jgi:signal transduction histidine kinase
MARPSFEMLPPAESAPQSTPDTPTSVIAQLTTHLLDVERVRSERVLNGVRAVVLVLLAAVSALYATRLTPSLNRVNLGVLLPMLLWTVGQQAFFHRRGHAPRWLSTVNAIVDTTALTVLLAGYGVFDRAELAVKSPMFLAYTLIIAAQSLTNSGRRAAGVSALAIVEYGALVTLLVGTGHLALVGNPLDTPIMAGSSLFDEGARIFFLAVAGGAATYATARQAQTLRRALTAQVQRDAEERALAVRLQEADKLAAVGTLAATVVHEVNNPLTSISMLAEMLKSTPLNASQREDVDGIIKESRRTAAVVRDLLRVSHPREARDEAISLSRVATQALAVLRPLLRDQRVSIQTELPDELPTIRGFASRLEQIVLNLVINAVQAMEGRSGPRLVRITTGGDSTQVWLCVEDNGPGFAPGVAERVFDRFFTTKPVGKGTGLGLWIAREIITEHGGTVTAENRPEGGARFRLRFPIALEPKARLSA